MKLDGESELVSRLEDAAQAAADKVDELAAKITEGDQGREAYLKQLGLWLGLRQASRIVGRYERELEEGQL